MVSSVAFWKAVVADRSNFLERVIAVLEESGIGYCVIDGAAVNAYAEPVVTQDLDIVSATAELRRARELFQEFRIEEFDTSGLVEVFPNLRCGLPNEIKRRLWE